MNDLWTWTTGWVLTVGVGSGQGRREQWGVNQDNCNRTIKIKSKNKKRIAIINTLMLK